MMQTSGIVVLVFGALTVIGGIMGYVKAQSLPSLVSGLLFGVALLASGWFVFKGNFPALYTAIALTLFLGGFFGIRLSSGAGFMPAGLMLILAFVTLIFLVVTLFTSLQKL
ncbi:MAG: TMEM14 family protein [Acidobacteriota bacterium]